MSEKVPAIYLVNGNDEFAITRFLDGLIARLGDASIQAMNLTRLDGRAFNFDDFIRSTLAMPFLAERRLVILEYPTTRLESREVREKFLASLGKIAPSTELALVEYKILTEKRDREKNRLHWLEEWAFAAGESVQIKRFDLPSIGEMPRWIQAKAKEHGGQFTRDAAVELAGLVGDGPRQADQEIQKLLAYVNFRRPVERDDVYLLTADVREGDIFTLVDAIGNRDTRAAMRMLQRLLEEDEPINIFSIIVRQFRLLLQAREILDVSGKQGDVVRELRLHPFVADKVSAQARRFSLPVLELIYHRLLETDEAMKTSQMPGDLALETLVASLGNIHPVHADPEVVW